jgi:hypothetical protein
MIQPITLVNSTLTPAVHVAYCIVDTAKSASLLGAELPI